VYHADPHDYYRYTVEGLRSLFDSNEFEIVESGSYTKPFTVFTELLRHSFMSPYKKEKIGKVSARFLRVLTAVTHRLDKLVKGDRMYGNSYLIARKK
jgi:hypothetical protein